MTSKTVIIVAGGRDFGNRRIPGQGTDYAWRQKCWNQMVEILKDVKTKYGRSGVVLRHGAAKGADSLAAEWAQYQGMLVDSCPANWDKYGKAAGRIRNEEMAKGAKVLIAFWDGQSRGTKHMIDVAMQQGMDVHVIRYTPQEG